MQESLHKTKGFKLLRRSKAILVCAMGLYFLLVTFNNLISYDTNYIFVAHVLSMDTIFSENENMWRAISNSTIHHISYIFIIIVEATIAVLCLVGGCRLFKSSDAKVFDKAKNTAIWGLTLAALFWFTGFLTIAGEWFLMWQSEAWNVQQEAFRMFAATTLVLLYLIQPERKN